MASLQNSPGLGRKRLWALGMVLVGSFLIVGGLPGQQGFTTVAGQVNKKMVKLFGAGGFKGLPSYGTGILISADGFILTVNNHILATTDLRVHLYDGRCYPAKCLAKEPELAIALVKIDSEVDNLPHFDFAKESARPLAGSGDWILAFSNQFQIATRDEPMSVQRGVISAHAELRGRRGVFNAPFSGAVYFLDVIACNPGAAGGIVTNRKGELLGILGRELRNTLTDTWINYAIPIQAKAEIQRDDKASSVDMATFVKEAIAGTYKQSEKRAKVDKGGFHGIILVPNVVSATPPYVEEVMAESPAAKAGLQADGLILYIDGEIVHTIKMFREFMKGFGPGMEVKLEVQIDNNFKSLEFNLSDPPKAKKAG